MTHSRSSFRVSTLSALALLFAALALAATAGASNATLRATLNSWSRKMSADAHSVALAARLRHPRRMSFSADRFRRDALHARAAVAAQKPSTAKGAQAKNLALAAFADYATAGSRWAASGRARLAHKKAEASRYARAAAASAKAGNKALVTAAKLLR